MLRSAQTVGLVSESDQSGSTGRGPRQIPMRVFLGSTAPHRLRVGRGRPRGEVDPGAEDFAAFALSGLYLRTRFAHPEEVPLRGHGKSRFFKGLRLGYTMINAQHSSTAVIDANRGLGQCKGLIIMLWALIVMLGPFTHWHTCRLQIAALDQVLGKWRLDSEVAANCVPVYLRHGVTLPPHCDGILVCSGGDSFSINVIASEKRPLSIATIAQRELLARTWLCANLFFLFLGMHAERGVRGRERDLLPTVSPHGLWIAWRWVLDKLLVFVLGFIVLCLALPSLALMLTYSLWD